jgi:hypothetical protein
MNNDGDCFGHDYEYQESLPSGSNAVQALWSCIHCGHDNIIADQGLCIF